MLFIQPKVPEAAILALGKFLMTTEYQRTEVIDKIADALTDIISQTNAGVGEARRLALVVIRAVGRRYSGVSFTFKYGACYCLS